MKERAKRVCCEDCKDFGRLILKGVGIIAVAAWDISRIHGMITDYNRVAPVAPGYTESIPTAQVLPEQKRELIDLPTKLVISRLGIDEKISEAIVDKNTGTWSVPENGLAVIPGGKYGQDSPTIIFGHSRWQGQPRSPMLFADLRLHEQVEVEAISSAKLTQQYAVIGLHLIDAGRLPDALLKKHPKGIFLMTSVKPDVKEGNPLNEWIVPKDKLADFEPEEGLNPDDPSKYVNLIIVLSQNTNLPSEGHLVEFN